MQTVDVWNRDGIDIEIGFIRIQGFNAFQSDASLPFTERTKERANKRNEQSEGVMASGLMLILIG